jgi:deferrochelatase/peroxidase EfeB
VTGEPPDPHSSGLTRRRLLQATGGGAIGLAGAGAAGYAVGSEGGGPPGTAVPFHGTHQGGIVTPPPDRLMFAAFDLTIDTAGELRDLLRTWSHAAALMAVGRTAGSPAGRKDLPPADTGEAVGLPAANLTVTFGLGPSVFLKAGRDRFGLASRRPRALSPLGPLPGDQLAPARSDGDLCVQACADDPLVAFHAVRDLARIGRGAVVIRWTQLGFGRAASTSQAQTTPRNLQGFKDGTNNLDATDEAEMRRFVWVGGEEPQAWMRGGAYAVTRRIRMLIETWDRSALGDQEATIGRSKLSGAPLGSTAEHDPVNLTARRPDGTLVIPADAHIREASHVTNAGVRILRRGYSYTDGIDPQTGELDAGLFFICFQRDPHAQFAVLQRRLGSSDALNEYIVHTSSAVFAIPAGIRSGGYVAEGLFTS